MSVEDLTKVQVYSASRHLEDARDAPAAVTIISAEEIHLYGWRTLGDVLGSVRGFYTSYDRDYTYLGVRGFMRPGDYNSRVLLMIDGHRLNENVYDSAPIGTEFPLDLDLIDHIEIVRGPSSSLYGTNGIFGVINVITRRPGGSNIEVSGEQSSFLGRAGRVTANLQEGSWSGLLSGSMYRDDGVASLYFPEFTNQNGGIASEMDGEHVSHAFGDLQIGNLEFRGLYGSRMKLIPTAPYGTIFDDPVTSSTDTRGYFDVSYHHDLSHNTNIDLRSYYDHYLSLGQGGFDYPGFASPLLGITEGGANWVGGEATLRHAIGPHSLTFGTEYEYNLNISQKNYALGGPTLVDSSHSPWMAASYADLELRLHSKLTLHVGGRFDYFSASSGAFSPRIAITYAPNSKTTLKYVYGQAFRAPNAYESYYFDNESIEAAPEPLKPEHISTHEVVFERALNSRLGFTADAYYNELTQLIDETPDPATGLSYFMNSGHDRGQGVEFEVAARLPSGIVARASYAFADARNLTLHETLANSPVNLAKLNGTLPLVHKGFLGAELLYADDETGYLGNRIQSSVLTNLTLSSKPIKKNWDLSASCYNIFNKAWFSPAGPELRELNVPQDGRTYRFKITYRLHSETSQGKP